jgi:adenine deaminase
VFSDLAAPRADEVYLGGRLVARDGEALFTPGAASGRTSMVVGTVHVDVDAVDLSIPVSAAAEARVIGLVPDQLITEHLRMAAPVAGGEVVADPERDLLKIAVIERHRGTGNVGKGLVRGFGLRRGALAGTFAHDHHNLVVVGADDLSMTTAARAVAEAGGGLAAAAGERVLALLPLPVAGLMSDRPLEEVRRELDRLLAAARELGSPLHDPFMALSFVTLEVIPALKITDQGLVDVERFVAVPLLVE